MSYSITNWWPGGRIAGVSGTYVMGAVGSDGFVDIALASDDDEAIFMYGNVAIGGTKVGGADDMTILYTGAGGVGVIAQIALVSMNANEVLNLPTAFADAAVAVENSIGMSDIPVLMLSGTDVLRFWLAGMANGEEFDLLLRFRSRSGVALTTGSATGVFS